ncbi:hypothetical protein MAPG_08503 [Magnaporthiopsis poae ATCC 64411]|uniref:Uncharacterized protein n=1 Tax=Magnaporthiopsis poae (strain ATCC 64411 / 73-15) TaxID=644358 RepID=A0A0C4E7J0_MAGP6|nr:hypothetical protein MAPG_08503 [Magnaporthiopsis poae ATCC 64411]
MSTPNRRGGPQGTGDKANEIKSKPRSLGVPCALLSDDLTTVVCCDSKPFAPSGATKVEVQVMRRILSDEICSIGLRFRFPRGDRNSTEEHGHGVFFEPPSNHGAVGAAITDKYTMMLWFPAGGFDYVAEDASPSVCRVVGGKGPRVLIKVRLAGSSRCSVERGGLPFTNLQDDTIDGIVNRNQPMAGGVHLFDLMASQTFNVVLNGSTRKANELMSPLEGPSTFDYGYGNVFYWDEDRYHAQFSDPRLRGHQFAMNYMHSSDENHVTAVSQAAVQDVFWLHVKARELLTYRLSAYAVTVGSSGNDKAYYFIIEFSAPLLGKSQGAIDRLVKGEVGMYMLAFDEDGDMIARWDATLVENPNTIEQLSIDHRTDPKTELVLLVCRPKSDGHGHEGSEFSPKTFPVKTAALAAKEKSSTS